MYSKVVSVFVIYLLCMQFVVANIDLKGAKEVVDSLVIDVSEDKKSEISEPMRLLNDIEAFRKLDIRSSDDIAKKWFELAIRSLKLEQMNQVDVFKAIDSRTKGTVGFTSLLASIPPPSEWKKFTHQAEAIDKDGLKAKEYLGLQMITYALTNDYEKVKGKLNVLYKLAEDENDQEKRALNKLLNNIDKIIISTSGDTKALLDYTTKRIENADKYESKIEIPDVYTLLGEEKATQWLQKALRNSKTSLSVPVGEKTLLLAQKVALQGINELKVSHLGLVRGLNCEKLYEALAGRFKLKKDDYSRFDSTAQAHYLISLIANGRTEDASNFSRQFEDEYNLTLSNDILQELEQAGYGQEVMSFLRTVLEENPSLPFWKLYIKLSSYFGEKGNVTSLLEKVMTNADLKGGQKNKIQSYYGAALLAEGNVDRGVEVLLENINELNSYKKSEIALKVANIGNLYDKKEWVEKGLALSVSVITESDNNQNEYGLADSQKEHVAILRELGRYSEAEDLLLTDLQAKKKTIEGYSELGAMNIESYMTIFIRQHLIELTSLYADASQWEDVLYMLDEIPYWGSKDLVDIYAYKDSYKQPLGMYVAEALIETSKGEKAKPILEALLERDGTNDGIYELYVSLIGDNAIDFLQKLHQQDQFEERPLIWMGNISLKNGDLSKAKEYISKAISIDPSDGEQGPGDRMRAYKILADILEEEGKESDSKLYNKAVKAIRLSEEADKFEKVGIHAKAIAMYGQAAETFTDAYCVQSRLAIQLTKQGRFEEAKKYYRHAYELMPDSFGRVESHCFGCENVFDDPRAQSIAEEVFEELIEKSNKTAQPYYMLGYLKKEQQEYKEAIELFRTSVSLDPQYLNAWKQIYDTGSKIHLDKWEHNIAAIKMLELDPLQRHVNPNLKWVTDLEGLWVAAEDALNVSNSFSKKNLYQLSETTKFLEQSKDGSGVVDQVMQQFTVALDDNKYWTHPSMALLETGIISAVNGMLVNNNSYY